MSKVSPPTGSKITSIGYQTFRSTGITTITMPASVTSIATNAFTYSSTFTMYIEYGNTMDPSIG